MLSGFDARQIATLCGSAFAAGILNAIAGGGSFLTFPALVFCGIPSIVANASSTVALFPGSFAATWAYRSDLARVRGINVRRFWMVSIVGGIAGAALLLRTPPGIFDRLVPWLLLFATLVFLVGNRARDWLRTRWTPTEAPLLFAQLLIAVYGGYFGGGIGILMLAALALYGLEDIHSMNAVKTLLAGSLNGVAVVLFVIGGKVDWAPTVLMLAAAIPGGWAGARLAHRIPPKWLRAFVIFVGAAMSAWFFTRAS